MSLISLRHVHGKKINISKEKVDDIHQKLINKTKEKQEHIPKPKDIKRQG